MDLLLPTAEHLPTYVAALERGWSPETSRGAVAAKELLDELQREGPSVLAQMDDPLALGPAVTLPDGSKRPRLPGLRRWIWDGEYCGSIGLRWQAGTTELPPYVLGHAGYAVVPWKRRLGYATKALSLLLPLAKAQGLPFIILSTNLDNEASQRVILANQGVLVERFVKPEVYGGQTALRYRIDLS